MVSSDFHFKENDGFLVLPVHPGLVTSNYGVHEVGVTVRGVEDVLLVLGVTVRPGTRHFPYNENPTRVLNTILLKCSLLSTDSWMLTGGRLAGTLHMKCKEKFSVSILCKLPVNFMKELI